MTEPTPTRKSGRQRVPNRKYHDDAFETLKLVLSSDSEDEEILQQQQLLQDDSDEFPANDLVEYHEDEDESLADSASDGSDIQTPVEEYEDAHSYASSDSGSLVDLVALGIPRASRRKPRDPNTHRDVNVHSRGMPENPLRHDWARSILKLFSGEGEDDIIHIVKARDRWAPDPTLPLRSSLYHGVSHTDDKRHMEATVGWDWYYDQGGRELFAKRQNERLLTADEAIQYRGPVRNNQEFLIGPYGRQMKRSLAPAQVLKLDQAWSYAEDQESGSKRKRHGWVLNVDGRVKCMDWAPNHGGSTQYLALVTAKSRQSPTREPPAFRTVPGPSVLQIWAFPSPTEQTNKEVPFLHSILCTDWGEVGQLKWCPVPRTTRKSATSGMSSAHVGLLAIVFGDGSARVIDVYLGQDERTGTVPRAQKYNGSGFVVPAPTGNPSTCLTWLSNTDLAIGYSNGHLAIYDICPEAKPKPSDTPNGNPHQDDGAEHGADPVPWLSMQLHFTYILALSSAYPTHPSLLLSSSLDGHVRLTSLLAPKTDYVMSGRTRSPPTSLAYCDSLLSVIGAEESSETVKVWGLRCFYVSFACAKLPASPGPGPGIVDVGKCHSTIATGSTDGSVIVTNPLRKILGRKAAGYQQCIFRHEWRPTPDIQAGEESAGHRLGMSRLTEGYRIEKINLNARNSVRKGKEMVPISTIHEEETAVTALAWNPNVFCGGWLAVGWCCGLVRVQDVAIDGRYM